MQFRTIFFVFLTINISNYYGMERFCQNLVPSNLNYINLDSEQNRNEQFNALKNSIEFSSLEQKIELLFTTLKRMDTTLKYKAFIDRYEFVQKRILKSVSKDQKFKNEINKFLNQAKQKLALIRNDFSLLFGNIYVDLLECWNKIQWIIIREALDLKVLSISIKDLKEHINNVKDLFINHNVDVFDEFIECLKENKLQDFKKDFYNFFVTQKNDNFNYLNVDNKIEELIEADEYKALVNFLTSKAKENRSEFEYLINNKHNSQVNILLFLIQTDIQLMGLFSKDRKLEDFTINLIQNFNIKRDLLENLLLNLKDKKEKFMEKFSKLNNKLAIDVCCTYYTYINEIENSLCKANGKNKLIKNI